jgi:hypothetical protein
MAQLQEMQITSPGVYQPNGQMNQQSSPISIHSSSRPIMIGSLPTDHHLQHFNNRNNQFYHSTSSPIATPNASQGASEYGTPSSTWHSSSAAINPHQTLLVNTGSGAQPHHGQLIPGSAPSGGYSDLIMEDLSMQVAFAKIQDIFSPPMQRSCL